METKDLLLQIQELDSHITRLLAQAKDLQEKMRDVKTHA